MLLGVAISRRLTATAKFLWAVSDLCGEYAPLEGLQKPLDKTAERIATLAHKLSCKAISKRMRKR
jgi:hypothetical protein